MMKTIIFAIVLGLIIPQAIDAACPNGCSHNGKCGKNDRCTCHQNWQGPDCSLRTCTHTLAWVDTALGTNDAHYYAECGNKGTCDRKTGECKCFDGYEGKGCRRSTCPEGCSGHGTCEYIEELAQDWHDYVNGPKWDLGTASTTIGNVNHVAARQNALSYTYNAWDTNKIQGCKCDLGYTGADCSARMVPKGDDPLTTDQGVNQIQTIMIGKAGGTANWATGNDEFFLVYHDPYGGVWRTGAIHVATGANAATVDRATVAASVQAELRALPNKVLDGVVVRDHLNDAPTPAPSNDNLKVCFRSEDGSQSSTCTFNTAVDPSAWHVLVDVLFQSKPGQTGVQYLLEVEYRDRKTNEKGFFPQSEGVGTDHAHGTAYEYLASGAANGGATNEDILTELEDCSGRGLDDGEGQCECFEGFRGLACEYQEALV